MPKAAKSKCHECMHKHRAACQLLAIIIVRFNINSVEVCIKGLALNAEDSIELIQTLGKDKSKMLESQA